MLARPLYRFSKWCITLAVGGVITLSPFRLLAQTASSPPTTAGDRPCVELSGADYSSHNQTVKRLVDLYQTASYTKLEDALGCLMRTSHKFSTGQPGSSAVYWMFRRLMPAPGMDARQPELVSAWRKAFPNSTMVEFAELRLRYAHAWNTRGGEVAGMTAESAMRSFRQQMVDAEVAMSRASEELKQTPIWHNLLLAIVQDLPDGRLRTADVFREAVSRWPAYYDFYDVAITRFVPRWGGSWALVDAFINNVASQMLSSESDSMYARLYAGVLLAGTQPDETMLRWDRMKESLDALNSRFPDPGFGNLAASLACHYNDAEYFNIALRRTRDFQLDASYWLRGADIRGCARAYAR